MSGRPFIPKQTDVIIGNMLADWRKKLGLSQKDVADKIGISFQQVQKYETAGNRISVSRLLEILDVMDVSPSAFFDETKKTTDMYDAETYYVIRKFMHMPQRDRKMVLELIRRLTIK